MELKDQMGDRATSHPWDLEHPSPAGAQGMLPGVGGHGVKELPPWL